MLDKEPPLEGDQYKGRAGEGESPEPDKSYADEWVKIAREAFNSSTEYMNANQRKQWERNIANFRNEHPPGSKYHTEKYKHRSRNFRPKTRTAVNKNDAAFAAAMFSTLDVVSIDAHNENDPMAAAEAKFWHAVLNYRLTRTLSWFRLAVGAFQEAQKYGAVISMQDWEIEERVAGEEMPLDPYGDPFDDENGDKVVRPVVELVKNQPRVKLIAIENMRFDPAADWLDPIGTSPYLIQLMPMYVVDVLEYMDKTDPETGEPLWIRYPKEEIAASRKTGEDEGESTESARTGGQTDKYDASDDIVNDFEIVWVHLNFIRASEGEAVFYTLGTDKLLSEPRPLEEVYPLGRPFTMGVCTIEPHRAIPAAPVELWQGLQASANGLENQRRDNVNLALNKRKFAQRNKGTDMNALRRSVPGGITLTDDIESIKTEEIGDVTSSSYEEQDRINADFDALSGSMDQGSVQTNRALNETVGGMNLLSAAANATTEFMLRTFVETWCEPVIRQLVELERANEDWKTRERFWVEGLELSKSELDVAVNVGFGSTDPQKKLTRLIGAITALSQAAPEIVATRLDADEVAKEVFGAAGYRDGDRFLKEEQPPEEPQMDPMVQVKMQELQLRQQEKEMEFELKKEELITRLEIDVKKLQQDRELKLAEIASKENITVAQLEANTGLKQQELSIKREIEGIKALNFQNELAFKHDSGRDGI
jgi:hypothetical protein